MNPCIGAGSSFDLTNAWVQHSNLGDEGPDEWAPTGLRYTNVGSVFAPNGVETFFDLLVTNQTTYTADNTSLNGVFGSLAQVNVACGTSVTLRIRTMLSCATTSSCAACEALDGDARESCYTAGCACFGTVVTAESDCTGTTKEQARQSYGCAWSSQGVVLPAGTFVAMTLFDLDVGSNGAGGTIA